MVEENADYLDRLDEEDIRLTSGFSDIFTAILLVLGSTALAGVLGAGAIIAVPLAAFFLAKPLVETRRFAACGIVLALAVTIVPGGLATGMFGLGGILLAAGISFGFWKRFRIPASLALAWIVGICFLFGVNVLRVGQIATPMAILAGLLIFCVALYYDAQDRLRQTRLTDVAFWLHLAAAPLLVHGLFSGLGLDPWRGDVPQPLIVLLLFFALTLVSLAIDRRPLLVSSFAYMVGATASLLTGHIASNDYAAKAASFADAALAPGIVGAAVLVLAAGWTPMRRGLLALLPKRLAMHLPPAATGATPPQEQPDDLHAAEKEPVRLVLGFNDLFVAMGASAMVIGSAVLGGRLAYVSLQDIEKFNPRPEALLNQPAVWLPIVLPAITTWLIAEYFVRIRRMAWPAIALANCFWFCSIAAGWMMGLRTIATSPDMKSHAWFDPHSHVAFSSKTALTSFVVGCGVAAVCNLLFFWRHRVPLSFALAVASLLPLLLADQMMLIGLEPAKPFAELNWPMRCLLGGVLVFVLAMLWDRADPGRRSQRADVAFWLHLLASALAIPSLMSLLHLSDFPPYFVYFLFVGIVTLSLAIDRRAPIAVALPFIVYLSGDRFVHSGDWLVSLVLVIALLALVLRWDKVRERLLATVGISTGSA